MLGSLEEGFETNIKIKVVFKPIQQGQLIDEDSTQSKTTGGYQPFGRHLTIPPKDALEMLIEVLHRYRTQLVEHTPHFFTHIGIGAFTSMRRYQQAPSQHTQSSEHRSVVMLIAQHNAHVLRQFVYQFLSLGAIIVVGGVS